MEVKTYWGDDKTSAAGGIAAYSMLKEKNIVLYSDYGSAGTLAVKELCARDHIPSFGFSENVKKTFPTENCWMFNNSPCYHEALYGLARYWIENWKGDEAPKLGWLTMDNAFGRGDDCAIPYFEKMGFVILAHQYAPYVPVDTTPQLLALEKDGADFVITSGGGVLWSVVLKDATRLGLRDKMKFGGCMREYSGNTRRLSGEACIGAYMTSTEAHGYEDEPFITMVRERARKKYGDTWMEESYGSLYMAGWKCALIQSAAIKAAAEKHGWDKVTGDTVKEALESGKGFDTHGIGGPPLKFTPRNHTGGHYCRIWTFDEELKDKPLTDWVEVPTIVPAEYEETEGKYFPERLLLKDQPALWPK